MPNPKSPRRFAPLGCGLGAAVALGAFVYLAFQGGQAGTAASAATLCLALAVLGALDLESFEGLGIKAKLRNTLSDAEERLKAIDGMTASLARASFSQAANGTVEFEEARAMVSDLTASLVGTGLDRTRIDDLKSNFYTGLAWYHWNCLGTYYERYTKRVASELGIGESKPIRADEIGSGLNTWARYANAHWPTYDPQAPLERFEAAALAACAEALMAGDEDRRAFRILVEHVIRMLAACLKEGNYTSEAIGFIKYDKVPNGAAVREAVAVLTGTA